jgi:hypothetical protein
MNAGEQHIDGMNATTLIAAFPAVPSDDDDAQLPDERRGKARSSPSDPNTGEQHNSSLNADAAIAALPAAPSDGGDAQRKLERRLASRSSPSDP